MDPERFFDVRQRIRRAGLPDTELYRRAENQRMDYEADRRQRGALQRQIERAYRDGNDPSELEAQLGGHGRQGAGASASSRT